MTHTTTVDAPTEPVARAAIDAELLDQLQDELDATLAAYNARDIAAKELAARVAHESAMAVADVLLSAYDLDRAMHAAESELGPAAHISARKSRLEQVDAELSRVLAAADQVRAVRQLAALAATMRDETGALGRRADVLTNQLVDACRERAKRKQPQCL